MRSASTAIVAIVAAVSACKSTPPTPPTPRLGSPYPAVGAADFTIDGRTGETKDKNSFHRGKPVRVVITDVNPFLYSYQITTEDEQVVHEPSPLTFFNIAFRSLALVFPDQPKILGYFPGTTKRGVDKCPATFNGVDVSAARDLVHQSLTSADEALTALDKTQRGLGTTADEQRAAFETAIQKARDRNITMDSVQKAAAAAATALESFVTSVQSAVTDIGDNVDDALVAARDAHAHAALLPEGYAAQCPQMETHLTNVDKDITTAKGQLDKARALRNAAQAAYAGFMATVQDRSSYYAIKMLKQYTAPTSLTVVISRKHAVSGAVADAIVGIEAKAPPKQTPPETPATTPPTVANTITVNVPPPAGGGGAAQPPAQTPASSPTPATLAAHRLHFGGRGRFSISAGVIVSGLDNPTYTASRRRINAVPGQSADTSEFVVALSDSGQFRVVPVITLNMLTFPFGSTGTDGVHLTFGTGLNTEGDGNHLGYFVGGGLSLFDSRFMATGGWYASRVQHLGGLRIGERVPTATLPSHGITRAAWAVGLVFRLY